MTERGICFDVLPTFDDPFNVSDIAPLVGGTLRATLDLLDGEGDLLATTVVRLQQRVDGYYLHLGHEERLERHVTAYRTGSGVSMRLAVQGHAARWEMATDRHYTAIKGKPFAFVFPPNHRLVEFAVA